MFMKLASASTLAIGLIVASAHAADAPGVKRVDLEKFEVPGSNYEVITAVTELDPGVPVEFHTHFGVEIGYVAAGTATLSIKGRPDRVIKAGDSFQVPAGLAHRGINTGTAVFKVVTTFVVEKGKPLRTSAPAP